ncbi:MAG: TetR/AcrR family transcriptional regulator [Terrimesophilobacter sp.]
MGRPKLFQRNDVLERALCLFWELGYHDASVRRLAETMGVNVATVFSEFGDKEGLYAQALERYESQKVPLFIGALERPDASIDTVLQVLRDFASFADSGTAPGCLITNSAIEFAPDPRRSEDALTRYVDRLQAAYSKPLTAALGTDHDAATARALEHQARSLTATTLGLFVMIRSRIPAAIVHDTVEGTIATLLSSLPNAIAVEGDVADHRSIASENSGSTGTNRKGIAP